MKHRYSNLYTWHQCQKKFELTRIQGLSDGSDKNADLAFGTDVHLAIDAAFEGGKEHALEVFSLAWRARNELEYGRLKQDALTEMGTHLITIFCDEHLEDIIPEYRETKINSSLLLGEQTIEVGGTPDCVGLYKGVPSIIDYKTSAMPYDAYKGVCNEQMYLYATMADRELAFKAEQGVYVVLIKDPKNPRIQIKRHLFNASNVKDRTDNVLSIFKQIEDAKVFTKNSGSCKTYNGVCPFWENCYGH